MWRAFDDISADNYIEKLVDVHSVHPETMLAVSDVLREASSGTPERLYPQSVDRKQLTSHPNLHANPAQFTKLVLRALAAGRLR